MAFILVGDGASVALTNYLSAVTYSCTPFLYTQNITPAITHVYTNFSTATAYSVTGTTSYSMGYVSVDAGGTAFATLAAPITWTYTGTVPMTVYGWYLANPTTPKLMGAELLSPAVTVSTSGDKIVMTQHTLRLHS